MRPLTEMRALGLSRVLRASVTPLASIFGSGFLIIVPVLERSLGALAVFGAVAVSVVAWLVGSAIRHNVAAIEPRRQARRLGAGLARLERASDVVIALAYIVSVALYLRIMAEYVVQFSAADPDGRASATVASAAVALIVVVGLARGFDGLDLMERLALGAVLVLTTALGTAFAFENVERLIGGVGAGLIASGAVLAIVLVGVTRGFAGLDLMERVGLAVVLVITTLLGAVLILEDVGLIVGEGLRLPPVPDTGVGEAALMLGGILITVQGFETIRYLGDEYDAPTRIWASRVAQAIAASIYISFVALATPLMGLGTADGADRTLLEITERVVPLLALPLVACAALSQFSAATADTVAADGNLRAELPRLFASGRSFVFTGAVAIALIYTIPLLTLIAVASRAFAAYYCLQCVVAASTATSGAKRVGFAALALVMAAIALFARPVG